MCVGVSVWLGWGGIRVAGCYTDTYPVIPVGGVSVLNMVRRLTNNRIR